MLLASDRAQWRPRLSSAGLVGGLVALVAAAPGCTLPGTGGELVEVSWRLESEMAAGETVLSGDAEPWEVELIEARALVGPVYVFAPPTLAQRWEPALRVLSGAPAIALAHAGDDNSDGIRVLAELLEQVPLNLVGREGQEVAVTPAEGGEVRTVNIVLDEARFHLAAEDGPTRGHHAWIRGVARRGDEELRFAAGLSSLTVPDDRIARRVEGLPVLEAEGSVGDLRDGDTLVVRADPREWVRKALFDRLQAPSDGSELLVEEPSQLHNAWYLGIRDPVGWTVRVER